MVKMSLQYILRYYYIACIAQCEQQLAAMFQLLKVIY